MRRAISIFASVLLIAATTAPALAAGTFAKWAAIVVAGDYHAHDGSPTEVFDNARRDITAALEHIGFAGANIDEFSVRPDRYQLSGLRHSDPLSISDGLWYLTDRATAGCMVYFTSHGTPGGVVVNDSILSPDKLNEIVGNACGHRPTVVFVSACFSGVFIPAMAAPNRFIMTAARADRTSFGCGAENEYTYFDDCFLQAVPASHGFPGLATKIRACVAEKEKRTGMAPPSDPQIFIGKKIAAELPTW